VFGSQRFLDTKAYRAYQEKGAGAGWGAAGLLASQAGWQAGSCGAASLLRNGKGLRSGLRPAAARGATRRR
jgi:hypothetical protein